MTLALAVAGTVIWADVLLRRTPTWNAWLQAAILVVGLVAAVGLALGPMLGRLIGRAIVRRAGMAVGGLALIACLAGPGAYSVATAATAHNSAIPTAGPSSGGAFGGGPRFGGAGGFPGANGRARGAGGAFPVGAGGLGGGAGLTPPGGGAGPAGGFGPGAATSPFAGRFAGRFGGAGGPAAGGGAGRGGGFGGLLTGSLPSKAVTATLNANASKYTWVAATSGSESASGYQLATARPIMAIGGFNGTDPYPTLAAFQKDVAQGKVHYFIAGGRGGGGPAGAPGSSAASDSSAITTWVEAHFTAKTVGGVTLYDLTAPLAG